MFKLSTTAKEAIKIALAITIAYYVSLRYSWMSPTWSAISVAMSRNFYQLLGNFQSLSQAAITYADTADNIDWQEWREERF